jgi:hypothetical protein
VTRIGATTAIQLALATIAKTELNEPNTTPVEDIAREGAIVTRLERAAAAADRHC